MRDIYTCSELISDSNLKYGFTLHQLFKIATTFFKANEGKVFHPSYDDRNRFLALALQAKHGSFDESRAPPLGAFDIVGHDRRKAWAHLGEISSTDAKVGFINLLESSCPTFMLFVEAHQKEREERDKLPGYISSKSPNQDPYQSKTLDVANQGCVQSNSKACHFFLTDEQRHAIKEWLNSQTYLQFRKIAEQIYPGDIERQSNHLLILQEEHFQQFFQQQPYLSKMIDKPHSSQSETPESRLLNDEDHHVSYNSSVTPSNSVVSGDINPPTSFNIDTLRGTLEELVANEAEKNCNNDGKFEKNQLNDHDESEFDLASIEVPQMWKNPDIKNFKDSILQLNLDGIIKVGHGEILTIRVPTYSDGTRIFWEFATDYYDIGFGLFFEWTENPGNHVSVHISDTEEEDDDDEIIGSMDVPEQLQDPEKGPNKIEVLNEEVPSSVLIPVQRRESHEEVFVGSHTYPGKGVYLLKFDNTYSLWRSKNLYYRIYYDKK